MKINLLTAQDVGKRFIIPYSADSSACVIARPVTATDRRRIYKDAELDSAHDPSLFMSFFTWRFLSKAIVDWRNFYDKNDVAIEYNRDNLKMVIEHNPMFFDNLRERIMRLENYFREEELKK